MSLNSTSEGLDQENITPNQEGENIMKKAQEAYIAKKIEGDIHYFEKGDNFLNDFISYTVLNEQYQSLFSNIDNISSEQKKVILKQLQGNIVRLTLPTKVLYNNIVRDIRRYKLSKGQIDLLKEKLKHISLSDLKSLNISESHKKDFLVKYNIVDKNYIFDEASDIFGTINISKKRVDEVKKHKEVYTSLLKLTTSLDNIDREDIGNIKNFFTQNELQNIFHAFVEKVSLSILIDMGFVSKEASKNIIKTYIKDLSLDLDQGDIDNLVESLDPKDFFIDSKDITDINKTSLLLDNEYIIDKVVAQMNHERSELRGMEELDISENDSFSSFLDIIDRSNDIAPEIKEEIKKMSQGRYLSIKTNTKTSNTHQYYYIQELELGTIAESKAVQFVNVTTAGGISSVAKGRDEKYLYKNFYDLLKNLSNLSSQERSLSVKTKEELEIEDVNIVAPKENIPDAKHLKTLLDIEDPEGRNIDIHKMSFSLGKETAGKSPVYTITINEKSTHSVHIDNTGEDMTYEDFLAAFSHQKCKRFPKFENAGEALGGLKEDSELSDAFKEYTLLDNKLIKKSEKEDKKNPGIKYLIGKNGEAIQILNINNNQFTYQIGKYSDNSDKKSKSKGTFKSEYKSNDQNYLYYFIKKNHLSPVVDYTKIDNEKGKDIEMNGSFLGKMMGKMSFLEVIMAGKQVFDGIENKLKQGNKLKSAKLALKMGKIFGEHSDIYTDLQSMVEGEEKKTMEELVDSMKKLDSNVMIPKVIKILQNKNSQNYEIEAALMATLKYGGLYPKGLSEYKGKWLWYKALGGTPGDELFNKIKAECEEAKSKGGKDIAVPFTEEWLVESLLTEQARKNKKPYRRSKFHKEFGNAYSAGIKDEEEDGEIKTGNKMLAQGRVDYVVGALAGLEIPNALGGLDNIWAKNGSAHEMNAIPFIIGVTGIGEHFDQRLLNKVIGKSFGTPLTSLFFNRDRQHRKLYMQTMEQIVMDMNDSDMLKSFQKIATGDFSKKNNKVYYAKDFWDTYGNRLIDRITLADGYIVSEAELSDDGDKKILYKNYIDAMHSVQGDSEFNLKKEDIDNGAINYGKTSLFYAGGERLFSEHVIYDTQGNIRSPGITIFQEALKALGDIDNLQLPNENKKVAYKKLFSTLAKGVIKSIGSRISESQKYPSVIQLKKLGIDVIDIYNKFGDDIITDVESKGFNDYMEISWQNRHMSSKSSIEATHSMTLDELGKII